MRYQGSKAKIAKDIIPIITQNLTEDRCFYDLFGGGMNLVDKVNHSKKVACDINRYVIALWKEIQKNGMTNIPRFVTPETYLSAKQSYLNGDGKFTDYEIGYIATCCSYGGGWFNGYAHFNPKKNEDHIAEAWSGLCKQVENFKHLDTTTFMSCDYRATPFTFQSDAVVYCDIPYSSTKKYENDFDNKAFWEWVRKMVRKHGTEIYVSEYDAPGDFKCIWQKNVPDGMGTTRTGMRQNRKIEKLFVYNG